MNTDKSFSHLQAVLFGRKVHDFFQLGVWHMGTKGQHFGFWKQILCSIEKNQLQNYRIRNVSPSKVFQEWLVGSNCLDFYICLYLLCETYLYLLCEKTPDTVLEHRQGTAVQQLMEILKPFILSGEGLNLSPGFL